MKDDTISRQAAIDALADYIHMVDMVYSTGKLSADDCKDSAHSVLDDLPSAWPTQTNAESTQDLISREAALEALGEQPDSGDWMDEWECGCRSQWEWDKEAIENVPAVQPQRMRGRWIGIIGNAVKCDQCGRFNRRSNYCPNCGADMRGGE